VTAAYTCATALLAAIALSWTGQPIALQATLVVVVALAGWLLLAWVWRSERTNPLT
jgi:hypothetical protein